MAKKSGETIDVARVISTGQDRKTGHAIVRLRADDGRVIALRLRPQQFRTLAKGVLGLAKARGEPWWDQLANRRQRRRWRASKQNRPAAGHPRGLIITSILRRAAKMRLVLPIRVGTADAGHLDRSDTCFRKY